MAQATANVAVNKTTHQSVPKADAKENIALVKVETAKKRKSLPLSAVRQTWQEEVVSNCLCRPPHADTPSGSARTQSSSYGATTAA